ncbi:MAG: ComEA family DNA-binding protein [Pseudomonas sp.]|jgi:competence protein ComEA|nr:ComEA family DNA-binding protein [Pseudomonas sp.]
MRKFIIHSLMAAVFGTMSTLTVAAEPQSASATQIVASIEQLTVDINSADSETLARELNGIGVAKARAIVQYREANGAFASVDELLEVKGIGMAILEKNRSRLAVK